MANPRNPNQQAQGASEENINDWMKDFPDMPSDKDGFRDETTPELEGWWDVESKVPIWGKIVGAFQQETDDGLRDTVIVKLLHPTMAIPAGQRGDDAKAAKFDKGRLIGIGIRHKLKEILNYVEHRGEIVVKPLQQKKIGGGRKMWEFEVRCKGQKAPPPIRQKNSDDVPF